MSKKTTKNKCKFSDGVCNKLIGTSCCTRLCDGVYTKKDTEKYKKESNASGLMVTRN